MDTPATDETAATTSAASVAASPPVQPPGPRFFTDGDFEAAARSAIGRAGLGGADIGLVFATLEQVTDGDATSWYAAWRNTADLLRAKAASAAAGDLHGTASWFYLAASDAYSRALFFVDGMPDDAVLLPTFRLGRECWDRFVNLSDGRHLPLALPYASDSMPGYLFRPNLSNTSRPTWSSPTAATAPWPLCGASSRRPWTAVGTLSPSTALVSSPCSSKAACPSGTTGRPS